VAQKSDRCTHWSSGTISAIRIRSSVIASGSRLRVGGSGVAAELL
jgi:hypothetical protein